ncbi:MAG: hypothetical protein MUO26_14180 [Methanotrichaceae archaeon]|nr:hypothetical protein [Methanotrichaceae archaeon]
MSGCRLDRGLLAGFSIFLISPVFVAIVLGIFSGPALAGTETGEFCPTCPDWTNLEGWLAQKEAYERAQMNPMQNGNIVNSINGKSADNPDKNYPVPEIITSPDAINSFRWTIIDVRDPNEYKANHLAGARNLYWRSTQNDGNLDPQLMMQELRRLDVNNSDSILIYGDTLEDPAYIFWALSYLGHKNLSVLNGGLSDALAAGMMPSTFVQSFPESNYSIIITPRLLVYRNNLPQLLNSSNLKILDARDFSDYGRSRLTNLSVPFDPEKLYDDQRIRDAKTLEDLLSRRGLSKNGSNLIYGTPGAYLLFYGLELMGYNATLLEGDWWSETEWVVSNIK